MPPGASPVARALALRVKAPVESILHQQTSSGFVLLAMALASRSILTTVLEEVERFVDPAGSQGHAAAPQVAERQRCQFLLALRAASSRCRSLPDVRRVPRPQPRRSTCTGPTRRPSERVSETWDPARDTKRSPTNGRRAPTRVGAVREPPFLPTFN